MNSYLGRKGDIINIDLLIAYILFTLSLVLMVQFVIELIAPFSNEIEMLDLEKKTQTLQELVTNEFDLSNFNALCNLSLHGLVKKQINYTIKGFLLPSEDSTFINPSLEERGVTIVREGQNIRLLAGGIEPLNNASIKLIFPKIVDAENISLESPDNYTSRLDEYLNHIIEINLSFGGADSDELIIRTSLNEPELIIIEVKGLPKEYVYIGNTPFHSSCGNKSIGYEKTSFQDYGTMSHESNPYLINLEAELAWTRAS